MANITNKLNKNTGENLQAVTVTQWAPPGVTAVTLAGGNESNYLGGLYNKDSTGYFKWMVAGDFPISRLTVVNEANFKKLVADFGTSSGVLLIDRVVSFSANYTIPKNITLRFIQGGGLDIPNGGRAITIAGSVVAEAFQIFFSLGIIVFTSTRPPEVYAEWFGVVGDGVTDNNVNIQRAVSSANKCTLKFVTNKTYRWSQAALPLEIKINLNGATIKPLHNPTDTSLTNGLFWVVPGRINPSTGYWGGGGAYLPDKAVLKFCAVEIFGGNVDLEFATIQTVACNADVDRVDSIYVHDLKISNFYRAIAVSLTKDIDQYGKINNLVVEDCTFIDGGAFIGLVSVADYSIGATSIKVKTFDASPIASKILLGRYIMFGTARVTNLDSTGYNGTSAVFKVVDFIPDATDITMGTLVLASGNYTNALGFVVDTPNIGLKAEIIANTWVLPVAGYETPTLLNFPKFNGTAGQSSLTRSEISTIEDTYANNLMVGQKISVNNATHTITSISPTSIDISPSIVTTFSNVRPKPLGSLTDAVIVSGNVTRAAVRRNKLVGAEHLLRGSVVFGKNAFLQDLTNSYLVEDNEIYYTWMGVEITDGGLTGSNVFINGLNLTAGQTSIIPVNPTSYKVVQKDIDSDGVNELLVTSIGVTDANASIANSYTVGDIFRILGLRGRYIITAISNDWTNNPFITVSRYDMYNKKFTAGGIAHTIANITTCVKLYTPTVGCGGGVKNIVYKNNTSVHGIRKNGGYHLSAFSYDLEISNNILEYCERISLEIGGVNCKIFGNTVRHSIFERGSIAMPSVNSYGDSVPNKGFGRFFTGVSSNLEVYANTFVGIQPVNTDYNNSAGGIVLGEPALYEPLRLIIKNNTFAGMTGRVLYSNNSKLIGTTNYSSIYADYFEFSNNVVIFSPLVNGVRKNAIETIFGSKTVVRGNTLVFDSTDGLNLFNMRPNPEMFGSGPFDADFLGNIFKSGSIKFANTGATMGGINDTLYLQVRNEDSYTRSAGVFTATGAGQTTINIPHGLGVIPTYTNINPKSVDARNAGILSWTENATNIIITLAGPATTGTNNLSYIWEAKL